MLLALCLLMVGCGGTEETEAGAGSGGEIDPSSADQDSDGQELPVDDPTDQAPGEDSDMGPGTGEYEPIAALDDLVDPQPAPIDDVAVGTEQAIIVRYQNGYAPCAGARVTVVETDSTIEVSLETGLDPNAAAMSCLAGITGYEQTVLLASPIGDRELIWDQAEASTPPSDTDDASLPSEQEQAEVLAPFIGLELADAAAQAEADGRALRVAELDGEPMMLTEDFVPSRLNVTVENGVVVGGYLG
jgi:hypothetical protein